MGYTERIRTWARGFFTKGSRPAKIHQGWPHSIGFTNVGNPTKQMEAYQGWVYAAVTVIARRVAGVDFELFVKRQGEREQVREHVFFDLMKRPNPNMTLREFKYIISINLDLTGVFYGLIVDNTLARPQEIWPLPPQNFLGFDLDGRGAIKSFDFIGHDGQARVLSREEVVYLRYPHPLEPLRGASPIQAQAHAYDIDLAVRVFQRSFFQNSARPDIVLTTDKRLTPEEAERILAAWREKHQGAARSFTPALLDSGLSAVPLSVSSKDFEFLALSGWTKDNILAAYNVPEGKLGLVKDVNRANALGIDITFNSECIKPRLDLMDDGITTQVLSRYDEKLEMLHRNPVPGDSEFRHKRNIELLDRGVLTINEVRVSEGLKPLPWGDGPSLDKNSSKED